MGLSRGMPLDHGILAGKGARKRNYSGLLLLLFDILLVCIWLAKPSWKPEGKGACSYSIWSASKAWSKVDKSGKWIWKGKWVPGQYVWLH